jgi:hypothetical protein
MTNGWRICGLSVSCSLVWLRVEAREIPVCVDVVIRQHVETEPAPAAPAAPPGVVIPLAPSLAPAPLAPATVAPKKEPAIPYARTLPLVATQPIQPRPYLKRMVEHYVTHERGYVAVDSGCSERIVVEMYPLSVGWTVFARFSRNGREEKIDQVRMDEFPRLAERLALALLRDIDVQRTINRDNVLTADSPREFEHIRGTNHGLLKLGTALLVGQLPTADQRDEPATDEWRLVNPMTLGVGYRGRFQAWGLDVLAHAMFGTQRKSARNNQLGGHADYAAGTGIGMHALWFANPRGVTSWYTGLGATFHASWFTVVRPDADPDDDRELAFGGGLSVDGVAGYEAWRASVLSVFVEAQVILPIYLLDTETESGTIKTWLPGGLVSVGVTF